MAELKGLSLTAHLECVLAEYKARESIYGYPRRKMYLGFPGLDFGVQFHGKRAETLLGPASGPHSQMAQNMALAFLGGARIIELKTVQVLDRLEIPRPCIDIRNIGYNVEWSQELRLEESFDEYVTAWALLKLLEELETLGVAKGAPFYDTIFDVSVGYDLKGIQSERMRKWLHDFRHADEAIQERLNSLPAKFRRLRNTRISGDIANSVTLSTFHGCPASEIEAMVEHLISEHGFHVIVKMNPTILGCEFVEKTLRRDLGYSEILLDPKAFEHDISFDDAVDMMRRLDKFAGKHRVNIGAKFTNTLVVKNHENIFTDEVMYLSGAPLHVLAMNAMRRFRDEMGEDFPISFSAGITKHNFVDAVLCNMRPVTTCTDLLKTGGYTRLFDYLRRLKDKMEAVGATTIEQLIISEANAASLAAAGAENANRIAPGLKEDPAYHKDANRKTPPKIDSHLTLFDCITCNKCLPVCPNAANFSIETGAVDVAITDYRIENGNLVPVDGGRFVLKKKNQIANLADFCNECGDCDTYCPELGGPFVEKPRFFFSEETYRRFQDYEGFCFANPDLLLGRIEGKEYALRIDEDRDNFIWNGASFKLLVTSSGELLEVMKSEPGATGIIHMRHFHAMKTLFEGIRRGTDFASLVLSRAE